MNGFSHGYQPIAVVGIGCRLPGEVTDAASFWKLLEEGRDAIQETPSDRWSLDTVDGVAMSKTCTASIPTSLVFRLAKPRAWTRNIGCF
jgi:acyl transferase domain-containing protein